MAVQGGRGIGALLPVRVGVVGQSGLAVLHELLGDSSVTVRAVAVPGVCKVLAVYFESVPFPVMRALLCRLVQDLVWDTSAVDVRVAVLQGLCLVLENRLSHTLLKELLPLLRPLVHDRSEKVRLAFLELLLLVKGMKMLEFYHICPIEHLLVRMEEDSVHVVKRIVALLVDAFKPSSSQKIHHCLSLLRQNPGAARRFYQLATPHLPPGEVVRFILGIQETLIKCIQEEEGGARPAGGRAKGGRGRGKAAGRKRKRVPPSADTDDCTPPDSHTNEGEEPPSELDSQIQGAGWQRQQSPSPRGAGSEGKGEGAEEEEEEEEGERRLSVRDSELVRGLLEVMVVVWEVLRDRLEGPRSKELRKKLLDRTEKNLPLLLQTFTDGPLQSALYLLASHLPHSSVKPIAQECLRTLTSAHQLSSRTHDHTSSLVALLSWRQTDQVIGLANQWLSPVLNGIGGVGVGRKREVKQPALEPPKPTRKKTKRGGGKKAKGGVGGEGEELPSSSSLDSDPMQQPQAKAGMAMDMLSWMMSHPVCMEELKKNKEFWKLMPLLKHSMALLEEHHFSAAPPAELPFPLLKQALSLHMSMCMHRKLQGAQGGGGRGSGKQEEGGWFVGEVREVLGWCERVLLPRLKEGERTLTPPTRHTNRKCKRPHPQTTPTAQVGVSRAREVVEEVWSVLSEMLLVGLVCGSGMEGELALTASHFLDTASGEALLPSSCKLLYQLCEGSCDQELEGIPASPKALEPSATLLTATLTVLQRVSSESPASFSKVWGVVSQCVGAAILASVHVSSCSVTPPRTLGPFTALVRGVVQAQLQHVVTSPSVAPPCSDSDLPVFVQSVLRQVTKDSLTTRLFGSHLCDYVSEQEDSDLSQQLLTHHAALQLLHVLSKGKDGRGEFARCVRSSLKLLEALSEEDMKRWEGEVSDVKVLVEAVQDRLYGR